MDVKLDKWHKCKVDIEVLKELSKKSDIKGFQHVSLFFGCNNLNYGSKARQMAQVQSRY